MPRIVDGGTTLTITPLRVVRSIEDDTVSVDMIIEGSLFGFQVTQRQTITFSGQDAIDLRGNSDNPTVLEGKIEAALIDSSDVPETGVVTHFTQADYDASISASV